MSSVASSFRDGVRISPGAVDVETPLGRSKVTAITIFNPSAKAVRLVHRLDSGGAMCDFYYDVPYEFPPGNTILEVEFRPRRSGPASAKLTFCQGSEEVVVRLEGRARGPGRWSVIGAAAPFGAAGSSGNRHAYVVLSERSYGGSYFAVPLNTNRGTAETRFLWPGQFHFKPQWSNVGDATSVATGFYLQRVSETSISGRYTAIEDQAGRAAFADAVDHSVSNPCAKADCASAHCEPVFRRDLLQRLPEKLLPRWWAMVGRRLPELGRVIRVNANEPPPSRRSNVRRDPQPDGGITYAYYLVLSPLPVSAVLFAMYPDNDLLMVAPVRPNRSPARTGTTSHEECFRVSIPASTSMPSLLVETHLSALTNVNGFEMTDWLVESAQVKRVIDQVRQFIWSD